MSKTPPTLHCLAGQSGHVADQATTTFRRLKTLAVLAVMAVLACSMPAHAQLTGIKTIPGDYTTFMAAVADLNTQGVGAGGVTFNIAAGHTETGVAAVLTIATNPPSATRPIVFRKNGAGTNPLLTAGVGTSATVDGIVKLDGVDYVTFDGIDLQEDAANTTATTQMEWGYALVKASATNGSQYNTIKNCTVTLNKANTATVGIYLGNHIATATTALTVGSFLGTSSYNKFYNNTVQNSFQGISLTGFASAAPFDLYDQGNQIGVDGVSANPNRVLNFGGGATGTANGIACAAQNNLKIFNTQIDNAGGAATSTTMNGISTTASTNASLDIYNNTITLASAATTSNLFAINNTAGGTGAGNTINIYGNTISGCTYPTATSGEFRGIHHSATATYTNIYNNSITNNSQAGTGNFNCINYAGSSAALCLAVNIYGNTISGNAKSGTAGNFNCVFASASTFATSCYNNMMFNNSAPATSSAVAGYFNFSFSINEYIYNNQFYNNIGGSGTTTGFDVRSGSGPTDKQVYGNVVRDISCSGTIAGILVDYGTNCNIYNNNIYNLSTSATVGSAGTPHAVGINIAGVSSVQNFVNTYNNYVSDIKAPDITTSPAVAGIAATGTAVSNLGVWHNTVFLNATTSSATTFSTAGILLGAAPVSINMSNNIVVNTSATGPTGGLAAAIQRLAVPLNSYGLSSGHNCLYAGIPSANRVIFTDGTNSDQTLQAFKNRVGPREQASFSEMPPFVNAANAPYDLHLQAAVATQNERGGKAITAVGTDFDGNSRNATTPDVGADEIAGLTTDIASPDIQYTLLTNSGVAPNRSVPAFATITDPSGIDVSAGTRPRLYYKKSTHANTYVDNTNATDGWKYVETGSAASPFPFTIDYSLLFGGGVVAGDVIQYFVTAQDLNATPRIGLNNGGFTTQPASVALAAANFPLGNTINQYTIVANTYTGVIPVGPAETVTSLTNAGGAFALLNAGVLSGNVTLSITGDLTAETGTFALNQLPEQGVGNYSVSIVPSAGVIRTISGTSASSSLIRLDGADRVTIDGRFGGAGRFLTIRNLSTVQPTVGFLNDAQGNTLRNCVIESGNTATSATAGGAINLGGTTLLQGNDNNTITANEIRDRSDVVGTSAIGINCVGNSAGSTNAFNSGCTISDNDIHDWYLLNGASQFGILVGGGNTGFSITGNSLYQTVARAHTASGTVTRGINVSNASPSTAFGGFTISGNFIGGSATGANGSDWTLSSTSTHTFTGIFLATGLIPSTVQNNTVRKINYTTIAPSANTSMFIGISVGQGNINVANNTIGAATGTGAISVNINTGGTSSSFTAGILSAAVNGVVNVTGNTIGGWNFGGTVTNAALIPQHIQYQGTPAGNFSVSNNMIGSTTTANSIQNNLTTAPSIAFGIRLLVTSGPQGTVSGNTVQNITDLSVATNSAHYGMLLISSVGATAPVTATNNIIRNIAASPAPLTPAISVVGIALQGYSGRAHNISGNTLDNIANPNTAVAANYTIGIQVQGSSSGGSISKNKVCDLRNANTGPGGLAGIYVSAGDGWTIDNNMVSIRNGAGTNDLATFGIGDFSNGVINLYYNTVYVGGSSTGATSTYAFARGGNSRISLVNNLLYNERATTGGSFAIGNIATVPGDGWSSASSNYNVFIAPDAARIGEWGLGTNQSFAQWKTTSGGDIESYSDVTANVPSATLFVNVATCDLNINPASNLSWYVNGKGIAGSASGNLSTDFGGTARSTTLGTPTDIGADEFTPNAGVNPIPAIASGAPAPGTTTTYTFAGRKLGELTWGAVGTPPSSITWNYFSSVPGAGVAPVTNINSYWDVAASGGSGYSYDIKSYYTVAEQNALADPSLNLGKKTGASAWNYLAGATGTDAGGKHYTRTGLNSFSQFTLGSNAATADYIITASVISGNGSITPSGAVGVTPLNNQGFTIAPAACYIIDSVFVDGAHVGAVSSYDFSNVAANHTIGVKFKFNGSTPTISITASPGSSVCPGTSVTFTATALNSGTVPAYQWQLNGGPVGTNSTTYTNATLVTGDLITCVVTSNDPCASSSSVTSNTITMNMADAVAPIANCNTGITVTLDAAGNGSTTGAAIDNGSSDNCTASGSLTLSLSNDTFTCANAGTNTVILTVTDASGNSATCTTFVNVVASAVSGSAIATAVNCTYNVSCPGATDGEATASGSGGCPGYTYLWSSGGTNAVETGLGAGTYTVTITDGTGSTFVTSVTLTEPAALQVTSTVSQSCFDDSTGGVDISVTGGNDCQGYTYLWSNGATTQDLAGVTAGSYTVTVTDVSGCTSVQSYTVGSFAQLTPSFTATGNVLTAGQPWTTYQWLLNGSPIGGANANTYTITATGIYALQVSDANGCSAVTDTSTVVGSADPFAAGLSLSIYPNPARGEFRLMTDAPISFGLTVHVTDVYGKRYISQELSELSELSDEVSFDLRSFAAGNYLVEVVTESGHHKVFKLVVQ